MDRGHKVFAKREDKGDPNMPARGSQTKRCQKARREGGGAPPNFFIEEVPGMSSLAGSRKAIW